MKKIILGLMLSGVLTSCAYSAPGARNQTWKCDPTAVCQKNDDGVVNCKTDHLMEIMSEFRVTGQMMPYALTMDLVWTGEFPADTKHPTRYVECWYSNKKNPDQTVVFTTNNGHNSFHNAYSPGWSGSEMTRFTCSPGATRNCDFWYVA